MVLRADRTMAAVAASAALALVASGCTEGEVDVAEEVAPIPVDPDPAPEPEPTPEPEPAPERELEPEPEPAPEPEPGVPPAVEAELVIGDGVSAQLRETVLDELAHGAAFVEEVTGYRTDDFTLFVFAEPEPLVDHYLAFHDLPEQHRGELLERWGGAGPEAGGGIAEAGRGHIFVRPQDRWLAPLNDEPMYVLTHEYVHVLQWEHAPDELWLDDEPLPAGPRWLVEGVADYLTALHVTERRGTPIEAQRATWRSRASLTDAPLAATGSWTGMLAAGVGPSYALGTLAAEQLAGRSGVASLLEYSEAVGATGDWRSGFEQTFGFSVEEFYTEVFDDPRE